MTILVENEHSITFTAPALLIPDDIETASDWARPLIKYNPAFKWVLGRYAESDRANNNKQYWELADLEQAQKSIAMSPLNMNHQENVVVGAFAGAELLYPTKDVAASQQLNPFIEALATVWKFRRPKEYQDVEDSYKDGTLAFSMESVAETVTCSGDNGCQSTFDYAGFQSPTYCGHLNGMESVKKFGNSHFVGGALITPPFTPGWDNALVGEIASDQREMIEAAVEETFPEADTQTILDAVAGRPATARQLGLAFAARFMKTL